VSERTTIWYTGHDTCRTRSHSIRKAALLFGPACTVFSDTMPQSITVT
jgi:hypothetical protein